MDEQMLVKEKIIKRLEWHKEFMAKEYGNKGRWDAIVDGMNSAINIIKNMPVSELKEKEEQGGEKKGHLCDTCKQDFPTCRAPFKGIVFGIDLDPNLKGAAADRVDVCVSYEKKEVAVNSDKESEEKIQ